MKYRVTVRGTDIELRGHITEMETLVRFSQVLADEFGQNPMIAASPMGDDALTWWQEYELLAKVTAQLREENAALRNQIIGVTPTNTTEPEPEDPPFGNRG